MKKIFSCLLVSLVTMFLTGCWDIGGGEKIGSITRLNRQGVFVKTWEAEIIRGGLSSGSGVMGQAFHFTIEDDNLAKEVEKAMNSKQEMKITYKSELFTWFRSDSNDVFLTKIEPLLRVVSINETSSVKYDGTNIANSDMEPNMTATVHGAASPSSDQILQVIKRQQDELEKNQKMMEQMLDHIKK